MLRWRHRSTEAISSQQSVSRQATGFRHISGRRAPEERQRTANMDRRIRHYANFLPVIHISATSAFKLLKRPKTHCILRVRMHFLGGNLDANGWPQADFLVGPMSQVPRARCRHGLVMRPCTNSQRSNLRATPQRYDILVSDRKGRVAHLKKNVAFAGRTRPEEIGCARLAEQLVLGVRRHHRRVRQRQDRRPSETSPRARDPEF